MNRIPSKSRKIKSHTVKRPKISKEHQQRIQKLRQSSTPLRERFREDLMLHKFAPRTVDQYMNATITFVAYFNRAPQFITDDEIRFYLRYQSEIRRLKSGSMGIIHGMLKFLYAKTLRIERPVLDVFRCPKDTSEKIILSQGQVAKALQCVRDIRYRTALEVPTLETLFKLADKLAYYKINQLQLYIEHTFAFARHSDMWNGADPLTAEEIIRLDHYCRERHIDLVPSLSTFGHFYMGLRSQRKKHLNELDVDAPALPFSFHDRQMHYTLNASDPESIRLVEDMLAEFLPLFSSSYFNICCDETFDLGRGKNAAKAARAGSTEKLYVDFLLKIIAAVRKYGKTAMFWGDIIAKAPELIKKLPSDTIPLEWDYSAAATNRETKIMQSSGLNFYVCPGVSGWNTFLNRINQASQNIVNYAVRGLKFGAVGLLNTDWGDYGHVNLLGCSYHGLALGAAAAWNCKAALDTDSFDRAFSSIEFGDRSDRIVKAWRMENKAAVFGYAHLARLFDPGIPEGDKKQFSLDLRKNKRSALKNYLKNAGRAEEQFLETVRRSDFLDPLAQEELLCGLRGNILVHEVLGTILEYPGSQPRETADHLRAFETRFAALWHRRNKPSEYYRVRELLMRIADSLDGMKIVKRK